MVDTPPPPATHPPNALTKAESCVLYHLAGYVIKGVLGGSLCSACKPALRNSDDAIPDNATLLQMKEYREGALHQPSADVFSLLQHVEQLFRARTSEALMECSVSELVEEAMTVKSNLPSCHDVKRRVITKYTRLRLRIAGKCINNEREEPWEGKKLPWQ